MALKRPPAALEPTATESWRRDWFAEYLGYLGWEDGPYLFRRDRESGQSYDQLRLDYEEFADGIVVVQQRTIVQPPVWPYLPTPAPPTPAEASP